MRNGCHDAVGSSTTSGGARSRSRGVLYEGDAITTVFFYHGNLWHGAKTVYSHFPPSPSLILPSQTPYPTGFPPEHELYDTEIALPERAIIPSKLAAHTHML